MTLTYINTQLDKSFEHELITEKDFGYTVVIKFTNGKKETYNNATEVHWRYQSLKNEFRVAIESNIHSTGCTYVCEDVLSVDISFAAELEDNF